MALPVTPSGGAAAVFGGPAQLGSLGAADLRRALVAAALADAPLAALVGTRVYPLRIPQKVAARPCLVYQVLSEPRVHTLDGPAGVASATVKLAAADATLAGALAVADLVRGFDGFTGLLSGSLFVQETVLYDEQDLYDEPADGSDAGSYWCVQFYRLRYEEAPAA